MAKPPLYVDFLCIDDVRNEPPSVNPESGITRSPVWADIENAIKSLDGSKVRMVIAAQESPTEDSHFPYSGWGLIVGGGGADGLYVCGFGKGNSDTMYYLTTSRKREKDSYVIMRGQPTDFDSALCVDLDLVLIVAREFVHSGKLPDSAIWTEVSE